MYNKNTFTYGFEIEWGDINRTLKLPEHLGKWDYSETDIINLREPFKFICADPLGINPYMGGEINTKPTKTWNEQIENIAKLKDFFTENNCPPTKNCLSHSHIHVHIPKLKENIEDLKKLALYIQQNQDIVIKKCGNFDESLNLKNFKNAKMYLKYDGGRKIPDYMINNILNLSTDFESFIKLHAAGKDGVSMGRPFRYGINMYSLKHTNTIEFRFFRSSTDINQIKDCFIFVEQFLDAALNTNKPISEIFEEYNFNFPNFYFDENEFNGWLKTRYNKERGKKQRIYYEI